MAEDRAVIADPAPPTKNYAAFTSARGRTNKYRSINDRSALFLDEELVTTDKDILDAKSIDDGAAETKAEEFTIPSFVSGDKFIVVKVWPE